MKRLLGERGKIIIAAAKAENNCGKNSGEKKETDVNDMSGITHEANGIILKKRLCFYNMHSLWKRFKGREKLVVVRFHEMSDILLIKLGKFFR